MKVLKWKGLNGDKENVIWEQIKEQNVLDFFLSLGYCYIKNPRVQS